MEEEEGAEEILKTTGSPKKRMMSFMHLGWRFKKARLTTSPSCPKKLR